MTRRHVAIVFEDERGYYLLEGNTSPRKRVNVLAEEVFTETDEHGAYIPSDEGPPCVQCDEAYANRLLDKIELEDLERVTGHLHVLESCGDVKVTGYSPDGEPLYTVTKKGTMRKPIGQLAALLEKADREERDFTKAEIVTILKIAQELGWKP